MTTTIQSHPTVLATAAATTAAALAHIEAHAILVAEVATLKLRAAGGDLDDEGASDLTRKAEQQRLGEITLPRRERALADARSAEVVAALKVLDELASQLEPVEREAAAAADALSGGLVDSLAQALECDTGGAYERDRGRWLVERYMPGTYRASVLRGRILDAAQTMFGTSHISSQAAILAEGFNAEIQAIQAGTATLKAALKAVHRFSA